MLNCHEMFNRPHCSLRKLVCLRASRGSFHGKQKPKRIATNLERPSGPTKQYVHEPDRIRSCDPDVSIKQVMGPSSCIGPFGKPPESRETVLKKQPRFQALLPRRLFLGQRPHTNAAFPVFNHKIHRHLPLSTERQDQESKHATSGDHESSVPSKSDTCLDSRCRRNISTERYQVFARRT